MARLLVPTYRQMARKDKVLFVEIAYIFSVFRTVGKDYLTELYMRRNQKTHQWEEAAK